MSQDIMDEFNADAAGASAEFNKASAENQGKNDASIDWPGRYRVKVKSVRKKDGSKQWPGLNKDSKGRWVYSLIFSQSDSHPTSPKGASVFHNIYVVSEPGATDEKKANTAKFAKPQLVALSGDRDFQLKDLQVKGCDTYGPDGAITRPHAFTAEYMVDVSIRVTDDGKQVPQIDGIERAKEGEVTFVQPRPTLGAPVQTAAPAYSAVEPGDANAGKAVSGDDGLPF